MSMTHYRLKETRRNEGASLFNNFIAHVSVSKDYVLESFSDFSSEVEYRR